ncbi:hypothetical protein LAZ67_5002518 [Cordylochernes scorpioides]|uniref:Glutamine amidotransferase type-2 domain-containing protein n=1 Tax=Cordylochernes scorpioides TaxID=51811 RepID=A0ABY6KJZ7_9ARAC|nr:hypothetical protein LAZ67_5002518 [Cordylochernes scorpioides]
MIIGRIFKLDHITQQGQGLTPTLLQVYNPSHLQDQPQLITRKHPVEQSIYHPTPARYVHLTSYPTSTISIETAHLRTIIIRSASTQHPLSTVSPDSNPTIVVLQTERDSSVKTPFNRILPSISFSHRTIGGGNICGSASRVNEFNGLLWTDHSAVNGVERYAQTLDDTLQTECVVLRFVIGALRRMRTNMSADRPLSSFFPDGTSWTICLRPLPLESVNQHFLVEGGPSKNDSSSDRRDLGYSINNSGSDHERTLEPQRAFCPLGSRWDSPITLHQSPSNNPCNGDTPAGSPPPKKAKTVPSAGKVLCWRHVKTDNTMLGQMSRDTEPAIRQVFVAPRNSPVDFRLKLYQLKKLSTHKIPRKAIRFYICSLSASIVVYKMDEVLDGSYGVACDEARFLLFCGGCRRTSSVLVSGRCEDFSADLVNAKLMEGGARNAGDVDESDDDLLGAATPRMASLRWFTGSSRWRASRMSFHTNAPLTTGEQIHQDVKVMEERYQGVWDSHMMTDYCLNLSRDLPEYTYNRK